MLETGPAEGMGVLGQGGAGRRDAGPGFHRSYF